MCDSRWFFTDDQLENSPSRKTQIDNQQIEISAEKEMLYRQQAAQLIQDLGQRLKVSQLCINTAIVYMHRFYAFHSFALFHRNSIVAAAFFLSAKVEEHPRKEADVIKVLNVCLRPDEKIGEKEFMQQIEELTFCENFLMQTLGFDFTIDHPHAHVVNASYIFRSLPGFEKMSKIFYYMATSSLHLTTMCLKYPSTVVAAFCIDITCRWSEWEFPESIDGKAWYEIVDENVTAELLKKLRDEFIDILDRSPCQVKNKIEAIMSNKHIEVPKPPVAHRKVDPPPKPQHKHPQITFNNAPKHSNIPKQQEPAESPKSQLGKRSFQSHRDCDPKDKNRPHLRQEASSPPRSTDPHILKQQTSSNQLMSSSSQPPKYSNEETSRKLVKFSSSSCLDQVTVSSRSHHESKTSQATKKRKFSSMSDGQVTSDDEREKKLRKFDNVNEPSLLEEEIEIEVEAEQTRVEKEPSRLDQPMDQQMPLLEGPMDVMPPLREQLMEQPPLLTQGKDIETSPQESYKTEINPQIVSPPLNIMNVKLTLLPQIDPYVMLMMENGQQSSSSESLSQEEIATFKQEVSERSDFNNNAELMNAGFKITA